MEIYCCVISKSTNDRIALELTMSLMSIHILSPPNRRGPRIDPRGNPIFKFNVGEWIAFQETNGHHWRKGSSLSIIMH